MKWFESVSLTNKGLKRLVNQDRVANFIYEDCGLFLVADGISGHYAGEKASQLILDKYTEWWSSTCKTVPELDFQTIVEQLKDVLRKCNREIRLNTPEDMICGSTLVLLLLQREKYALLSAGDSRCYQVTAHKFLPGVRQLTYDDVSLEQYNYGKLTQAVGCQAECGAKLQSGEVPSGTVFALCSDGVYKFCSELFWKRCLISAFISGNLRKTLLRISDRVQGNGAKDNYSLVLVRVL